MRSNYRSILFFWVGVYLEKVGTLSKVCRVRFFLNRICDKIELDDFLSSIARRQPYPIAIAIL